MIGRLRAAFAEAASRPWFDALADMLLLDGFAEVSEESYAPLLEWDRAATAAGFQRPA
jgi:hypothetical protein